MYVEDDGLVCVRVVGDAIIRLEIRVGNKWTVFVNDELTVHLSTLH